MSILQTAERVSHRDKSDNYVFQRSLLAYVEAAKLVSGDVLEIGTGSGYGIEIIAPQANRFTTIDKFASDILREEAIQKHRNVTFKQLTVPPLTDIPSDSYDYVITFQVIEHIVPDDEFVQEIHRVLKPGGQLILTTPNKKMSLTRNPWHIREYTVAELHDLLQSYFSTVDTRGVFGKQKAQDYYEKNKKSVEKITKLDVFNLQYKLPRQILQIPYDILNRVNRRRLLQDNNDLVSNITMADFFIGDANDNALDLFYVATK